MIKRWIRKCKRRKPGVYWYTTRRHLAPGRESGYVGETWDLPRRHVEHIVGTPRCKPKDWNDLKPRRYALPLPWWLGWKWVLRTLETLAILMLKPRYNWSKNPWPGKVGPIDQARQRAVRDAQRMGQPAPWTAVVRAWSPLVFRAAGMLFILAGVMGVVITRA